MLAKAIKASRVIDRLNTAIANWASWLVPVGVAIVVVDVAIRLFTPQYTLIWPFDLSWMLFSFYFMLAIPYTLLVKGHVKIDIVLSRWRPRARAAFEIAFFAFFALPIILILIINGVPFALDSITQREVWMGAWLPPVYQMKSLIPVGFLLLLLQVISEIIKCFEIMTSSSK